MQQEKSQPFTREDMKSAPQKLLRDGRTANAVVTKIEAAGRTWTVKDFSSRPWFVRWFIAPVLLSRELAFLNRLEGVDGIADSAFRIDRYAIAVQFMPGESIGKRVKERITPDFLEKLEALVDAMHARGVVHLDLRGLGNVMIRPDDTPGIIDFQSSLFTGVLGRFLKTSTSRAYSRSGRSTSPKRWATRVRQNSSASTKFAASGCSAATSG